MEQSSLVEQATEPVGVKIDKLREQLDAQAKMLKQTEDGFQAKYEVFVSKLEKDGIVCTWPAHKMVSEVKVMLTHDDLDKLVDGLVNTAANLTEALVGFAEDADDVTPDAKAVFTEVKDDLHSAMKVFLAAQVGVEKSVSQNQYIIVGYGIRLVYLQSYNISLQAGALDGKQSISAYIFLANSAEIDIFKSDLGAIVTKIGVTQKNMDTLIKARALVKESPVAMVQPTNRGLLALMNRRKQ